MEWAALVIPGAPFSPPRGGIGGGGEMPAYGYHHGKEEGERQFGERERKGFVRECAVLPLV